MYFREVKNIAIETPLNQGRLVQALCRLSFPQPLPGLTEVGTKAKRGETHVFPQLGHETPPANHIEPALSATQSQQAWCPYAVIALPQITSRVAICCLQGGIFMHAALSEDLAQHKKARWLTPAIFAILRGTVHNIIVPQILRIGWLCRPLLVCDVHRTVPLVRIYTQ